MAITCVQILLIGICCGLLTCCIAQVDTQRELWCEGVEANTYVRNATDCRLWIRCNGPNSSPSAGICPNPSYFSVELQRCTSKNDANCIVCPDTTSTSYQPVANSCNRFIRCKDGVASELTCGIGMGFNPETNKCDPGFLKICTDTKSPPPTDASNTSPTTITVQTAEPGTETVTTSPTTSTSLSTTAPMIPTPWNPNQ